MRILGSTFTVLTVGLLLSGCSQSTMPVPTAPGPGATALATQCSSTCTAMVVDQTGVCLTDATVRIVNGQSVGQILKQSTPCDAWSRGGVDFKNLTLGVALTLRASAPGYLDQDMTVVPSAGAQTAVLLSPSPMAGPMNGDM